MFSYSASDRACGLYHTDGLEFPDVLVDASGHNTYVLATRCTTSTATSTTLTTTKTSTSTTSTTVSSTTVTATETSTIS